MFSSSILKVCISPILRSIGSKHATNLPCSSTGDLIGMFFGYYSLLVYQIQAIYVTLFLRNRDLLTFYCCFTHLLSEIINYILKHLIKQPRPDHGAPGGGLFEGRYGMPSQHCHCFAFLVTMSLLLVFHYYRKYIDLKWKLFTITTSSIALTLQVIGRIYLRFHTTEQCMVGVAVGSLLATTFYLFGTHYFLPYTEQLCELKILRILSFRRDLVTEPPSFKPKPISKSIKTR